jgi:hypothetical protein
MSDPVTIEDVKSVMFPLMRDIHSKVPFIVSGILRRVEVIQEGEEAEPEQFLLEVDSNYTEET